MKTYQRLYYDRFQDMGKERDNLPRIQACTLQPHSLLHLAEDVKNWGPASIFAQWLPEGYLGYIKGEADSPPHMILSMSNGVMDDERYIMALLALEQYEVADPPHQEGVHWLYEKANPRIDWRSPWFERLAADLSKKEPWSAGKAAVRSAPVRAFGGLRLKTGAVVVAAPYQRQTSINRDNSHVAFYYNEWGGELLFGRVHCLLRIERTSLSGQWDMAYISSLKTFKQNGLVTATGSGSGYWVVADFIAGLIGIAPIKVESHGKLVIRRRIVGKDGIYDEVNR